MFEHLTNKKSVTETGRKGLFLIGSSAIQAGVVIAVLLIASMLKARVPEEPVVPVKLVRAVPTPPTRPPAAPVQPPVVRRRPVVPPKPATALIAPRTIPASTPDKPEPEEESSPAEDTGEGVAGGAMGGTDLPSPTPAPPPPPVIKDEPTYAGAGFVRPRLADKACVQTHLHLPRGLEGMAAALTVKFAISTNGTPGLFSVQPADVDVRLSQAIWEAIRSCQWIPGTDPQGQVVKIWVLMPFRFQAN